VKNKVAIGRFLKEVFSWEEEMARFASSIISPRARNGRRRTTQGKSRIGL
jgi:hypothetical protein